MTNFDFLKDDPQFSGFADAAIAAERILPIEIKAAVADMRVLALDIATKEVRHQLKAWCEEQISSSA